MASQVREGRSASAAAAAGDAMIHRVVPAALTATLLILALKCGGYSPAHAASFTVNSTLDAVDASPGDGLCADATGACTLRAAIMETNALPGADEITLPAGVYALSIPPLPEPVV